MTGVHPRIREVVDLLKESRRTLAAAVQAVPEDRRAHRPGPERWSTAQVLDHLTKVEGSVAGLLGTRIAAARAAGLGAEPETSPVVDQQLVRRILDRTQAIEASGTARPASDASWTRAWSALADTRAALFAAIAQGDGLALGTLTFPHRALGTLDFYQWMVFVAAHEARHAAQIRAGA